jgi:hypothetical protein
MINNNETITSLAKGPESTILIKEASGSRRVSRELFVKLWLNRAYEFHQLGFEYHFEITQFVHRIEEIANEVFDLVSEGSGNIKT